MVKKQANGYQQQEGETVCMTVLKTQAANNKLKVTGNQRFKKT